ALKSGIPAASSTISIKLDGELFIIIIIIIMNKFILGHVACTVNLAKMVLIFPPMFWSSLVPMSSWDLILHQKCPLFFHLRNRSIAVLIDSCVILLDGVEVDHTLFSLLLDILPSSTSCMNFSTISIIIDMTENTS
ncbi:hypothetical protein L9F63_010797, partial [Diploptera punctata]